jgi:hypothetical protein
MTPAQPALDAMMEGVERVTLARDFVADRYVSATDYDALRAELVSVLQREAATTKRYDDRLDALRAALVAMRERAEGAALHEADLLKQRAAEADDAGHDTAADFYRESEQTARNIAALIRALPLDAPAPVDPVAEAARQEKDGLSETERQLRRALAQEARHD